MVSFTGHDGSEPIISSKSPDPGSTTEVPKDSAPATPHISAENNVSSELVAGQPKAVRLRQLSSIIPGRAPIFVNEKQYEPILRWHARRARIQANQLNVKNCHPRGSRGRSIVIKGKQERTNVGISQAPSSIPVVDFHRPFIGTNEDEENVGEAAYDSIPAVYFHRPFVATNEGEEHVGEAAYDSIPAVDFYGPFVATNKDEEHVGEAAYNSIPAVDFHGPFVATNEDEEHIGEAAYDSILNLKPPDFTSLLRIMMGDKYNTDVTEEFKKVASLESPDFTTLLLAMNNASYDEAAHDDYYCVDKVKLKLSGWL